LKTVKQCQGIGLIFKELRNALILIMHKKSGQSTLVMLIDPLGKSVIALDDRDVCLDCLKSG
jgi:hypothetical protein